MPLPKPPTKRAARLEPTAFANTLAVSPSNKAETPIAKTSSRSLAAPCYSRLRPWPPP